MKKILVIIIAVLCVGTASGQGFYFGIRGGMNVSSFTKTTDAQAIVRGNVGVFGGLRISTIAAIQVEALYSFQGSRVGGVDVQTDYLKIPLIAKVYLIKGLNVEAGVSFDILTSALTNGSIARGEYNGFNFSIPVGLAYQFGRHFEIGTRYDIAFIQANKVHRGANSTWSVNVAWRF